ncbi:hypothetical protein [Cupriavidus basilensis]
MSFRSRQKIYVPLSAVFVIAMLCYGFFQAPLYSLLPFGIVSIFYVGMLYRFRRDGLHPALIIGSLYFLSSFLSLFVDLNWLAKYNYRLEYDLHVLLIYSLLTVFIIIPSLRIGRASVDWSKRSSLLDFIVRWSWPLLVFSVIYLAPFAFKSLVTGAELVRSTVIRDEGVLPVSPLTTIAVGVAQFFSLFTMLWYYAAIKKYPKYIQYSMLLGPLAGILWGFVFASRDVLIWVPLMFLLGYWYWEDYLSSSFKSAFKKIYFVFFIAAIAFFSLFTFQRFSSSEEGIMGSIVGYFGYQPYVFAEMVSSHQNFYGLNVRLPFFAQLLGTYEVVARDNPYEWQFGTMLADFYGIFGWLSLFLSCAILVIFFLIAFRRNFITNQESRLILMVLYFNILTQGVFYFRLGSVSGNQYMVLMLLLAGLLNAKRQRN